MDFSESITKGDLDSVVKCFYCPYHGKTEGDGAGGWCKCTCQMASIHQGEYLPDAEHIVKFLDVPKYREPKYSSYESVSAKRTVNEKVFPHLKQEDVDKVGQLNSKTLKCKIKTTDCFKLQSKSLEVHSCRRPCGCDPCRASMMSGDLSVVNCENAQYMRDWQAEMMQPLDTRTEYTTRHTKADMLEMLARGVTDGEVIAVEHSDRDLADTYEYFLLKADGPGRVLVAAETDNWGAEFIPGDTVVSVVPDN
jgi:hypothetical protein